METFSALLVLCAGNSPVTGEFPTQGTVTRSFDVFFEWLSKQSWGWWFETPSRPLWRHCNGLLTSWHGNAFRITGPYVEGIHPPAHGGFLSQRAIHAELWCLFITLKPGQNGRHFTGGAFKCLFLDENIWISINILLKFVLKGPINNIPASV